MNLILKIAFLNVLRNNRRSIITILAIIFGCVSLIVYGGYVEAMYEGLRESTIRSQLGHIQIFKRGFNEFGNIEPEKYLLTDNDVLQINKIIEEQPDVEIITRRLNFNGLISNGKTSTAVMGVGINAEEESLLSSYVQIAEGEDLFPDELDGGLIGKGLAESLSLKVGDWVTLLAATADGGMNAVDISVKGIITTVSSEYDKRLVRANLPHIQNLMYTDSVSRMVVLLKETDQTFPFRDKLVKIFADRNLDLEVRTWSELTQFYHQVVKMFNSQFLFIRIIVMVIVVLSIANTMVMAVMERTTEIGTIRALGNTRSEILALFITESIYLGLIGGVLGIAFGIAASKGITAADIIMPPPPGSSTGFPIRIFVVPRFLWQSMLLGLLAAVLSSIYPAIKAAQLKIVDALRFV